MITDKNVEWNVKRDFIPVHAMMGRSVDQLSALAAGAAVFQEAQADSELSGLAIAAAGDEINTLWKLPWDIDRTKPVQMRIWFAHSSTDADTPDWKISLDGIGVQEALSDPAAATPDATLTFAAKAVSTTANTLEKTLWQKSTGFPFAATDVFAAMCVECNGLGSAGANEITLLGVEIAYTVAACGESTKRDDTGLTLENQTRY